MKFVVTSINGAAGSTAAQVVFQTPPPDPNTSPQEQVPQSSFNLSVPMANAGDYVVGTEYNVNISKVG